MFSCRLFVASMACLTTVSLLGSDASGQIAKLTSAPILTVERSFSLGVRDDVFDPVPIPFAFISQGGISYGLTGGPDGNISAPDMALNRKMAVRFEELMLPASIGSLKATTIGQHFTYKSSKSVSKSDGVRLVYCQPKARQLAFKKGYWPVDDLKGGWAAETIDAEVLTPFDAYVAELPTTEIISNYYAYSVAYHETKWLHGVLMRMDETVYVDNSPLIFAIDRDGYDYGTQGPIAGSDYMGSDPLGQGHTVTFIGEDADAVYLMVTGELRVGDNLLLLRNPYPTPAPPYKPIVPPVIYLASSAGECPPPAPVCNTTGTCTPSCWNTPVGGISCRNHAILLDGVVCAPCGAEVSKEKCSEFKGGLVAKMAWSVFGGELSVTASGEVSGKVCSTVTALPGFCAQGYSCLRACTRGCLIETVMEGIIIKNTYDTSCSIEGITSATSCQHTVCP
jgi:hypothetical protein